MASGPGLPRRGADRGRAHVQWRAEARTANHLVAERDVVCKSEIATAIRRARVLTESRFKFSDACDRWAGGSEVFEIMYYSMSACFGPRGDWSNYRQHFDAALILREPERANRVFDALDTALAGARLGEVKYPSLGAPPRVPLCVNM